MIIELTDEQQAKLQGLMIEITIMALQNKPGMLIAQVRKKHMEVRVLNFEQGQAAKRTFDKFAKSGEPTEDYKKPADSGSFKRKVCKRLRLNQLTKG